MSTLVSHNVNSEPFDVYYYKGDFYLIGGDGSSVPNYLKFGLTEDIADLAASEPSCGSNGKGNYSGFLSQYDINILRKDGKLLFNLYHILTSIKDSVE